MKKLYYAKGLCSYNYDYSGNYESYRSAYSEYVTNMIGLRVVL